MKTLIPRGVGRPDYSQIIERGKFMKDIGIIPYNAKLKFFVRVFTDGMTSLYPWVMPTPLSPGETVKLIDTETATEMPYTILPGYNLKLIMIGASISQPAEMYVRADGEFHSSYTIVDYEIYQIQELSVFESKMLDPTLTTPHTVEIEIKNMGDGPLRGTIGVMGILIKEHTKDITSKDVKCPFCGNIQTVPLTQTKIICSRCGKTYMVYAFPFGGGHV